MRFHHSTRRGRNRLGQHNQYPATSNHRQASTHPSAASTSRWSQLGYCRETSIHFNRRLPVELPEPLSGGGKETPGRAATASVSSGSLVRSSLARRERPLLSQGDSRAASEDYDEGVDDELKLNRLTLTEATTPRRSPKLAHQLRRSLRKKHDQAGVDDTGASSGTGAAGGTGASGGTGEPKGKGEGGTSEPTDVVPGAALDLESARERLVAKVEKHPFWSSKAARRMHLTKAEERRVYVYELISFCERRDLEWRYESYRGGLVSSVPFRRLVTASASGSGYTSERDTPQLSSLSTPSTPLGNSSANFSRLNSPPPLRAPIQRQGSGGTAMATCSGRQVLVCRSLMPGAMGQLTSADSLFHSTGSNSLECTSPGRSPIRRSRSSTGTGKSATPTTSSSSCEPLSILEHQLPSAEYVWSLEAPARVTPEPFTGQVHSFELPSSSFVKRCHGCQGRGRLKCSSCYGVGYEVCIGCSGKGTMRAYSSSLGAGSAYHNSSASGLSRSAGRSSSDSRNSIYANGYADEPDSPPGGGGGPSSTGYSGGYARGHEPGGITSGSGVGGSIWSSDTCHYCHGAGQKRCWVCAGKSYNHCLGCLGSGQLRCYLVLNITWLNHRDEVIVNNSDNIIPRERLRLSSGSTLVDETADHHLMPLQKKRIEGATMVSAYAGDPGTPGTASGQLHGHEVSLLQSASRRLLEHHQQAYRHERFHKQRHRLTQIQCNVISYEWKQRQGHFVIYGKERKVYIAKYPFKSFCSIA